MRTLGIDFAASAKRTACCLVDWDATTVQLLDRPLPDADLVRWITEVDLAAIDVPLGWPDAFVAAITAHHAGGAWPVDGEQRDELRFRLTDREIQRLGAQPLSVSSDKIGVPAMRAGRLQRLLAEAGVKVDRSGVSGRLIEVYPAAALRVWGFRSNGYKGKDNRAVVAELCATVLGQFGAIGAAACEVLHGCDDDEFDAFICAVLARAARTGHTTAPSAEQLALARREGWIHLPTGPLEALI